MWLAGHSLGGALTVIAAAIRIHEDKPFSGLYTFGQPRCMSTATCRTFNMEAKDRYFRFQNNNDIVTRVPSRFMGYGHSGQLIYISEEKKLYKSPGWWFRFLDGLDGAVNAVMEKGLDHIEDHESSKYLNAVKDWGDKPVEDD